MPELVWDAPQIRARTAWIVASEAVTTTVSPVSSSDGRLMDAVGPLG
ncbi:MAG: hypothetical protein ACK559_21015 [bacterium]